MVDGRSRGSRRWSGSFGPVYFPPLLDLRCFHVSGALHPEPSHWKYPRDCRTCKSHLNNRCEPSHPSKIQALVSVWIDRKRWGDLTRVSCHALQHCLYRSCCCLPRQCPRSPSLRHSRFQSFLRCSWSSMFNLVEGPVLSSMAHKSSLSTVS